MRLFLIRHPQPVVAMGLCYGSSDLAVATDEVERVAFALRPTLPVDAALYSSPLQRCTALANRLHQTPCHIDARLAELHFGAWENRAWDAIPRTEIDAWAADPVHYHPGGGESVLQMAARVSAFLAELLERPHAGAALVCHAGTIRLLTALHSGAAPEDAARQAAAAPHKIGYGSTVTLEF